MSDRGIVRQRILDWRPEERLSFRMEETSLPIRAFVREMVDTIVLVPSGSSLQVTRTTTVRVSGRYRILRKWLLRIGIKQVHRYVFRSWLRLVS